MRLSAWESLGWLEAAPLFELPLSSPDCSSAFASWAVRKRPPAPRIRRVAWLCLDWCKYGCTYAHNTTLGTSLHHFQPPRGWLALIVTPSITSGFYTLQCFDDCHPADEYCMYGPKVKLPRREPAPYPAGFDELVLCFCFCALLPPPQNTVILLCIDIHRLLFHDFCGQSQSSLPTYRCSCCRLSIATESHCASTLHGKRMRRLTQEEVSIIVCNTIVLIKG